MRLRNVSFSVLALSCLLTSPWSLAEETATADTETEVVADEGEGVATVQAAPTIYPEDIDEEADTASDDSAMADGTAGEGMDSGGDEAMTMDEESSMEEDSEPLVESADGETMISDEPVADEDAAMMDEPAMDDSTSMESDIADEAPMDNSPPMESDMGGEATQPMQGGSSPSAAYPNELNFPERGMNMEQVESLYGAPLEKMAPVGHPPITRWRYREFTVYFEFTHVLHSVINH